MTRPPRPWTLGARVTPDSWTPIGAVLIGAAENEFLARDGLGQFSEHATIDAAVARVREVSAKRSHTELDPNGGNRSSP